jgi:hypothetical protein
MTSTGGAHVLIEHISECVWRVDPPVRVWVDVARVHATSRDHTFRDTPHGLDLTVEVLGWLGGWAKRGDGGWLALVTYALTARDGTFRTEVTHFVPAHLVRRHSLVRNQRHTRGGLDH